MIRSARLAISAVVALAAVVVVWFALQAYPIFATSHSTVIVHVHSGETISAIASDLHANGVIGSPLAFRISAMLEGNPTAVPGSYQFKRGSSFSTVRAVLNGAPNVLTVSVRPGLTVLEVAQTLSNDLSGSWGSTFLAATEQIAAKSGWTTQSNLDGLIGTGSYLIAPGTTPHQLATTMFKRFEHQAKASGVTLATTLDGLSAYEIIIAASIVEKEGYFPVNMPKVGRVILNRLAVHQALQMDSTVLYALHQDGGRVTPAMLKIKTPYNTYLHAGLIPSPVCVPSATALRSLLHAPIGTWRYFVVIDKAGHEAFSTTYAGQIQNERLARSRGL